MGACIVYRFAAIFLLSPSRVCVRGCYGGGEVLRRVRDLVAEVREYGFRRVFSSVSATILLNIWMEVNRDKKIMRFACVQ